MKWKTKLNTNSKKKQKKIQFEIRDGVFQFQKRDLTSQIPSSQEFYKDLDRVFDIISSGPIKTFSFKRLTYLQSLFETHLILNEVEEQAACKVLFYFFISLFLSLFLLLFPFELNISKIVCSSSWFL